jgi:hypothetical protein
MATDVPIQRATPRSISLPHGGPALAGLAATAGLVHLVAMVEHLGIDWELGVFFACVAIAQFAAAWLIYRHVAILRLLGLVAAGSLAVALLWVFSRTTGLPFGPDAGRVAKVGFGDTIATLLELAFAAIAGLVLWHGDQRVAWLRGPAGVRLTYALLTLAVLMAAVGGHEH